MTGWRSTKHRLRRCGNARALLAGSPYPSERSSHQDRDDHRSADRPAPGDVWLRDWTVTAVADEGVDLAVARAPEARSQPDDEGHEEIASREPHDDHGPTETCRNAE